MILKVKNCEEYQENYSIQVEYKDSSSIELYPDGKGGQLGDRGTINGINILEVKKDKIIVEKPIQSGEYEYFIDEQRRYDIAVQHSVEHLFSGVMFKYYDKNNVGFKMSEEYTTIDFDCDNVSEEMVREIERKINDIILQGAKISTKIISKDEVEKMKNLRKKVSPKITDEQIRLVEIEGHDLCACAGFHVKDIREVRVFKIIAHKRIKGKYTRFTFLAGQRAIDDYIKKSEIMKILNQKFSCRDYELVERIEKDRKKYVEIRKEYNKLRDEYKENK